MRNTEPGSNPTRTAKATNRCRKTYDSRGNTMMRKQVYTTTRSATMTRISGGLRRKIRLGLMEGITSISMRQTQYRGLIRGDWMKFMLC